MILDGDTAVTGPTLDALFRRAGVRTPQAPALCDPPNRESFTDGAVRKLNFAEADRAISRFAARLHALGLKADAVVAIQLPNTVDAVIALLGVLRAGMIAAPLPLLWRQQDIVAALREVGAKAIVSCARAGAFEPVKTAVLAAAELFPIRHVCAFGQALPDGVVPLDDVFEPSDKLVHAAARPGAAAAHVAIVTFEVAAGGVVPMARHAGHLIAAGAHACEAAGLAEGATILSAIPPASFAGIALAVVPWLMSGGTLALHHGFDADAFDAQTETLSDAALILPGPALAPLAEAGRLLSLKTLIAVWRAPERLAASAPWYRAARLVDVCAFGEAGLSAAPRGADGRAAALTAAGAALDIARTRAGTLALRGAMVPARSFPSAQPLSADGFLDTGYSCTAEGDTVTITAAPAGLAAVGGYRFAQQGLDALLAAIDPTAAVMTVPDGLLGERLAGRSADPETLCAALRAHGANPLIADAFRLRAA